MAVVKYLKRRNYNQSAPDEEQTLSNDTLSFERTIYQKIGDRTANKVLVEPAEIRSKFDRWLVDMNNYQLKLYYPNIYPDLPEPSESLIAMDQYLGSLGITNTYPYSQDTYYQPQWLSQAAQTEYRVLVDESDNTYLTDENGTEVLVSYKEGA